MFYQGAAVSTAIALGLVAALSPVPESRAELGSVAPALAKAIPGPIDDKKAGTASGAGASDASRAESPKAKAATVQAAPSEEERTITVRPGDTFMKVLRKAGAAKPDAAAAVAAMRKLFDPRDLPAGQDVTVIMRREGDAKAAPQLIGFTFDTGIASAVKIDRGANDVFTAEEIKRNLARRELRRAGRIKSSLYQAGVRAGLPASVLVDLIRLYSWDVDFQRDIHPGDRFDVVFERFNLPDGSLARHGNILYAELRLSGEVRRLYRYKTAKRPADYFDLSGQSARKALLKTPIDGARLSSGFGRRRHPILGYNRMHRGIDFAAPRGTPVYAAGGGQIVRMGRNGSYGRYVRIRHNGRYSTAYAHLRGFARGLGRGKRVRQGQVVGYVGSSGRSTGPHLHYEVLVDNRQVNPFRIRLPSGRKLAGQELKSFEAARLEIDRQVAALPTTPDETRITSR